jgi:NAD(P)-dependent dehydrogenase (short-subunit alcohol dehydrogenase family)
MNATPRQIAVVTGANRGLGRASAGALARRGFAVVLTYRGDAAEASRAVGEIRDAGGEAIAARLDLRDVVSFAGFTTTLLRDIGERWGSSGIDVLVNNAGVGLFGRLEDATVEDFDALIGTNLRGTFFLIQALAPHLAEGGRIVSVSSSLTRHVSPGHLVVRGVEVGGGVAHPQPGRGTRTPWHPGHQHRAGPDRHRLQRRRHA